MPLTVEHMELLSRSRLCEEVSEDGNPSMEVMREFYKTRAINLLAVASVIQNQPLVHAAISLSKLMLSGVLIGMKLRDLEVLEEMNTGVTNGPKR